MSQNSMSQEYARAVYALALESWQNELQSIEEILASSPDLMKKLAAQTPFATRQEHLNSALPEGTSDQARNFLYTLLKNGHLSLLGDIAKNLTRLATKGPGVEVASVTTAIALTNEEKAQFEAKLAKQYGDTVAIDFLIDETIMGGVIVQVGDKIMDGSVASKLEAAKIRLSSV